MNRRMPSCQDSLAIGMSLRPWPLPRQTIDRASGNRLQITALMIALPLQGLRQAEVLPPTRAAADMVIASHSRILPRTDFLRMVLNLETTHPQMTVKSQVR